MWAFLHTKTGTAMTAVGSNPTFDKAAGVNVDKMRMLSVIMSTWLAAVGILVYEQGFGFIQIYTAPFYMALPAVSAILIGGASVNKASIANVIIGTFLFQGIVTMTPAEYAIIAADLAIKKSAAELGFVDRFSGTLIITGMVADVETSLRAIMDYAERTLKFTVCEITKT